MKEDSSDDDGFVPAKIEIHQPNKTVYQNNIDMLPEANPIYQGVSKESFGELLFVNRIVKSSLYQDSLRGLTSLSERYSSKNFQLVYQRYNEIADPRFNFTGILRPSEWFSTQLKSLFKKGKQNKKMMAFDSQFESGNLCSAYQVLGGNEYELLINNDTNTKGISNLTKQKITIKIVNFVKNILFLFTNQLKSHSFFHHGMQPIITKNQISDHQPVPEVEISNITYSKNNLIRLIQGRDDSILHKNYYTLEFDIKCECPVKQIFISMNYPYSYQKLEQFITKQAIQKTILCQSILKYNCFLLNITNHKIPMQKFVRLIFVLRIGKKRVIVIARQHPGETVGSFVMEGFIKYITGSSPEAQWLKDRTEFIILPMINIDGVQIGNFRCNLTGNDLNRIWNNPNKINHPIIHKVKSTLAKLICQEGSIDFFMDLHGHSKKLNTFLYGCRSDIDPIGCRVYPKIIQKICPYFNFEDCTFAISKHKLKTARAYVFRYLKDKDIDIRVKNVFTLETSFFGYEQYGQVYQYQVSDLFQIGYDLIRGLFLYWGGHQDNNNLCEAYKDIDLGVISNELQKQASLFQQMDELQNESDIESDSSPEEDILAEKERKFLTEDPQDSLSLPKAKQSKSVTAPKTRSTQRNSVSDKFKMGRRGTSDLEILQFQQPTNQEKQHKNYTRAYFTKKRLIIPEKFDASKVTVHSKVQDQVTSINHYSGNELRQPTLETQSSFIRRQSINTPKEVSYPLIPVPIKKSSDNLTQFQVTKSQFKRKLQGMFNQPGDLNESNSYSQILQKEIKKTGVNLKHPINFDKVQEIRQQQPKRQYDLKQEQSQRRTYQQISLKSSQHKNEDQVMSQLLSGIWAMNHLKYGQQLQQPKIFIPQRHYKNFQEDEDLKQFDDKKIQSRRYKFR